MNTAYQLAAKGVGGLFITPESFIRVFPQLQKNLAFCSLQDPPYAQRSMAVYRSDNAKMEMVQEILKLSRERVLPQLD